MSKQHLGAGGAWPRVPKFAVPPRPAGYPSGDHIVLDEEDERILDKVWAEIIGSPPAAPSSADGQARPAPTTAERSTSSGAVSSTSRRARKPAVPR